MRVAITGATGRLGRTIINTLLNDEKVKSIVALDLTFFNFKSDKVEFHQCDVCDKDIERFFSGCDAVIHLAFIVEFSRGKARALIDNVNVEGSKNVFNAVVASGVKQVVYTSSIVVYGMNPENNGRYLTEEMSVKGYQDFYYSDNKVKIENWLDAFSSAHPDIRLAVLRPSLFFSEKPSKGFFKNVFTRPRVVLIKGMDALVYITHGDDIASACILALMKNVHGKFNITSDEPLTLEQIANLLGKRTITLPKIMRLALSIAFRLNLIKTDPVWINCFAGHGLLISTLKVREELGWEPHFKTTADVVRELARQS